MRKFYEGQVLIHKISKEKYVLVKYRCLFYRIVCYHTSKEIIDISKGGDNSNYLDVYESELRRLTNEEIKQMENVEKE